MLDDLPLAVRWAVAGLTAAGLIVAVARATGGGRHEAVPGLYSSGRASDLGHIVMLAAIFIMVVFPHDAVPSYLWQSIFGALAAVYTVLIVIHIGQRRRAPVGGQSTDLIAAAGYHLIAALAMLYPTLGAVSRPEMYGLHREHAAPPPLPVLGWIGVAFFLADLLGSVIVAITLRFPGIDHRKLPKATRVAVFPHAVMDLTMSLMLVTALVGS
ncbi:DUF5134 domain-containing protein [Mycobacterium sp. Y57]|uniref:DUF5134 domain-containing protein n=1 Tax=Mycolicibacterium xanthum TaxID=2796469 RepID=UPI001C849317|nr:DUF5134 domain-containing protein [Mycolicibacterium xanthum]MBX7435117.1 DUF5134 domain-containing protein [Mycolicibacterium xanthum]